MKLYSKRNSYFLNMFTSDYVIGKCDDACKNWNMQLEWLLPSDSYLAQTTCSVLDQLCGLARKIWIGLWWKNRTWSKVISPKCIYIYSDMVIYPVEFQNSCQAKDVFKIEHHNNTAVISARHYFLYTPILSFYLLECDCRATLPWHGFLKCQEVVPINRSLI